MLRPTPVLLLLLLLLGACTSWPSLGGRTDGPTIDDALLEADAFLAAGRYGEAGPLLEDARPRAERLYGTRHPEVAPVLSSLARVYEAQGRYADAEPLLRRAVAIRQDSFGPDHPATAASLADLAWFYAGRGRLGDAMAAIRRADAVRRIRVLTATSLAPGGGSDIPPPPERNVVASRHVSIGWRLAQQDPGLRPRLLDETFRAGQRIQASDVAAAVARVAARVAIGEDELARLVRDWLDLVQRRSRLDRALARAVRRPQAERDGAAAFLAEARLRRELAATNARLNAVNDALTRRHPTYKELTSPVPAGVAEVQSLLAPDEALLVYAVAQPDWELESGGGEVFLWAVRRDRAEMARLDLAPDELEGAVRSLRTQLDPGQWTSGAPPRFDAALAHRLHAQILPADPSLLAGANRLLIVPDGALESLPFSVLIGTAPGFEAGYREVDWLARGYAIVTLPSVSSLRVLRRLTEPSSAERPFRGVGDPVLTGTPPGTEGTTSVAALVADGLADPAQVRALPPLPETADELRELARSLGAGEDSLLLEEEATEAAVKAGAVSRARVVAFATHAGVAGELPGLAEPALILTPPDVPSAEDDGVLTVSEVAELSLDAAFVVLSACNTAAPDGTPGAAGLSGLAKAFLHAGTRSLLVSHWAVLSDAAERLTTGMFAELARNPGLGRAEALRRSQLALLNEPQHPYFAHPAAWAPFVVVGADSPAPSQSPRLNPGMQPTSR